MYMYLGRGMSISKDRLECVKVLPVPVQTRINTEDIEEYSQISIQGLTRELECQGSQS